MKVEIWSDVVCPWCYIGKRRFETALARFQHRDQVEVVWRSFELDPGAPQLYPGSLHEMLAAKFRCSLEQAKAMNTQVTELAAAEGLDYRLDEARPGNTFDAHRLLHLAAARGLQAAAKERLLKAYFTEGRPIGDHETLVSLIAEVGVDAEEARAVLATDAYTEEVRGDAARARALGANGVPFFVFDERYGVSGAQSSELFLEVLEQAWTASRPLTMVGASSQQADRCDDGGCEI